MAWYKQTTVWAVIISVMALVLSQLPPVVTWIPKNQTKVEIGNKIWVGNNIGIAGYQVLIDLENNGNRNLTISNFELQVVYPNATVKLIKADSYLKNLPGQSVAQYFPITTIRLGVGERWVESLMFHPVPSPNEEEEINRFKLQISQSIWSKFQALGAAQYTPNIRLAADSEFVNEAINFFNHRFDLEKGIYKVSLICDVNSEKVTLKRFEFTLYDYHIKAFKLQTDDYKYGYGLVTQADQNKQVWALISKID
jgi:hypothetical protein